MKTFIFIGSVVMVIKPGPELNVGEVPSAFWTQFRTRGS